MAPKKNNQKITDLGRLFAGLPQVEQPKTQPRPTQQLPIQDLGRYLGGVGPMPTQEQIEEARVMSEMAGFPRPQGSNEGVNVGGAGSVTLPQDFFGGFKAADYASQFQGFMGVPPVEDITVTTGTGTVGGVGIGTATGTTTNKVSAFDRLRDRLKARGLESLYDSIKGLIEADLPEEEFTIQLRQLPAYTQRFAANEKRISKGLRPLTEAQYLLLEDQYQDVMRRYGLPESYYARGAMGTQPGFEKFLESDVSPVELEDRIQTAQNRVINAAPEIKQAFQEFYPGVTNGDILGYVLNTSKDTLNEIKRKATAAEIGGAARGAGLYTGKRPEDIEALRIRAEQLGQAGITQAAAQKGFQTIAELTPRGSQLAQIYDQTPYTQTTAEQEVFGLAGAAEAAKQRKKLTQLETSAFSGQSGMGALARDRAGAF